MSPELLSGGTEVQLYVGCLEFQQFGQKIPLIALNLFHEVWYECNQQTQRTL